MPTPQLKIRTKNTDFHTNNRIIVEAVLPQPEADQPQEETHWATYDKKTSPITKALVSKHSFLKYLHKDEINLYENY